MPLIVVLVDVDDGCSLSNALQGRQRRILSIPEFLQTFSELHSTSCQNTPCRYHRFIFIVGQLIFEAA